MKNPKHGTAKLSAKIVDKRGFSAKSGIVQVTAVPPGYTVAIAVADSITKLPVALCQVKIQDSIKYTDAGGKANFAKVNGLMNVLLQKKGYKSKTIGQLSVFSDTTFHFFLIRSEAEIKFVLLQGTTPVNDARVVIRPDTITSTSLGIARFGNKPVPETYNYHVFKNGYQDVFGSLLLKTDTTVNILMELIQVGIDEKAENGNLKIWPNPVEKILSVSSAKDIEAITVYSLTGGKKTIQTNSEQGIYQLDFSTLEPGAYLLEMKFANKNSVVRKVICK